MERKILIPRADGLRSQVIFGSAATLLGGLIPEGTRVIAIADANIDRCHGELLEAYEKIIIGQGESVKTLHTVEELLRELVAREADRSTFLLGVGGGIVTDVTGFVASIYMRGVHFGFVPTTLLAQVDASVGGKNGVNLDGYKNMVGCFNQPDFVVCDSSLLASLPDREFRAGLSEMIKAAVIGDEELFEMFEGHTFEAFRDDAELLSRAIERSVRVKAAIVERDEREAGERRLLNLGHTIGHAIEKSSRQMLHGEAVAAGMAVVARWSAEQGICSGKCADRICSVLERYGLPVGSPVDQNALRKAITRDKKRRGNRLALVVPVRIGECRIEMIDMD